MLAQQIVNSASTSLQDDGFVRWSQSLLLGYLNEGLRKIVRAAPDAFRETRSVLLATGSVQAAPEDCAYLFGVTRNMGADGATVGPAIRRVDRESLEAMTPRWAAKSGREVTEFAQVRPFDRTFLVNPPISPAVTAWVQVEMAAYPATVAIGDDIGVADGWEQALLYWILHRVHIGETEEGSSAKAEAFFKGFQLEVQLNSA